MREIDIENRVLELVGEDYYGLWEVTAIVRSAHEGLPEDLTIRTAQRLIRRLVDRGAVAIYRGSLAYSEERQEALSAAAAHTVLARAESWRQPTSWEDQVLIGGCPVS